MNNELIKQLLEANTKNDFRYSDLVHNAMSSCLYGTIETEEEILDCSELFSIENVIKNRHGKMFVYNHKHKEDNIHIDIVRARRKVDISLKYLVNSHSTIENLMGYINKYIGDNKAVILDASIDNGINIAFIKEYRNIDNVVINKELCLLRVSLSYCDQNHHNEYQSHGDISYVEKLRVITSKIYHSFLSSEFAKKADEYMEELKSKYSANFAHIYLDTLNNFFTSKADSFIGIKSDISYCINKELSTCDFITEHCLKIEQFKKNWNNFISVAEYNKVLEFALNHAYSNKRVKKMNAYNDAIITACIFFFYNIDKTTMNLAREAKGNNSIQTSKDVEDMYIKAIDIALITSKDILAAILDNEAIEIKIEPMKALNLLKIYNLEAELLSAFKDEILNPIINAVIEDVIDFKEDEKLKAIKKEMNDDDNKLSEN